MQNRNNYILAINCGSSSLKFGLYHSQSFERELSGSFTNIDTAEGVFKLFDKEGKLAESRTEYFNTHSGAARELARWIRERAADYPLAAIGHRMVFGGPDKRDAEIITSELISELHNYIYLAPNHLSIEIDTIKTFHDAFKEVPQVICYDTAFHHDMPWYAKYYPLPENYRKEGLIRYGFHGLSYEYVMTQLKKENNAVNKKKIIIAHLGSGSSMVAIEHGKSVETTMGVSPMGGLVMSTRSGDLDPGAILFLLKRTYASVSDVDELLSKYSGLKAIAGNGNIGELLKEEHHNEKAAQAITLFCYQARKYVGALAAAMGGLDLLVFTGGIGENLAEIRERICNKLDFLGIDIQRKANHQHEKVISSKHSRVTVMAIPTNEELMIVKHARRITSNQPKYREYENADLD